MLVPFIFPGRIVVLVPGKAGVENFLLPLVLDGRLQNGEISAYRSENRDIVPFNTQHALQNLI